MAGHVRNSIYINVICTVINATYEYERCPAIVPDSNAMVKKPKLFSRNETFTNILHRPPVS